MPSWKLGGVTREDNQAGRLMRSSSLWQCLNGIPQPYNNRPRKEDVGLVTRDAHA